MATTLTADQRWLMWAIGGWMMRECLLSPAGTDYLMSTMYSAHGRSAPEGAPSWLTGWNTSDRKIFAPSHDEPRVVLTAAQINAYACQIPAGVRSELQECASADHAEQTRVNEWCRCPYANKAPNAHSEACRRYHPTADEERAHHDISERVHHRTSQALRTALGLDVGQLDLFADNGQLALFTDQSLV